MKGVMVIGSSAGCADETRKNKRKNNFQPRNIGYPSSPDDDKMEAAAHPLDLSEALRQHQHHRRPDEDRQRRRKSQQLGAAAAAGGTSERQ